LVQVIPHVEPSQVDVPFVSVDTAHSGATAVDRVVVQALPLHRCISPGHEMPHMTPSQNGSRSGRWGRARIACHNGSLKNRLHTCPNKVVSGNAAHEYTCKSQNVSPTTLIIANAPWKTQAGANVAVAESVHGVSLQLAMAHRPTPGRYTLGTGLETGATMPRIVSRLTHSSPHTTQFAGQPTRPRRHHHRGFLCPPPSPPPGKPTAGCQGKQDVRERGDA